MSDCERAQRILYQYVADGEPATLAYGWLRAHLAGCAACRAQVVRVRAVESALRAMPVAAPPVGLTPAILLQVVNAGPPPKDERQLFSWESWVPVVAFSVALLVAMISMPANLLSTMTLQELESALQTMPGQASGWLAPLEQVTRTDLFWVIWSSVFVTTAGIGLSLSLKHLSRSADRLLAELSGRVAEVKTRTWRRMRSAH